MTAYNTYTFLDLKQAVYVLLHGQKFAETEAGTTVIANAINRAQAEVLQTFGTLAFAGSCYGATSYPADGTTESFSFASDNVLVPIAADIKDATSTYATAGYVEPSRYFRLGRSARATKEYQYTFIGNSVYVRPLIPNTGSCLLYSITQPVLLAADGDVMTADPRLFRSIAIRAAWNALQKFPSTDPQRLEQLSSDLQKEYAALSAILDKNRKEEYESRTGKDLEFEGKAPAQGG